MCMFKKIWRIIYIICLFKEKFRLNLFTKTALLGLLTQRNIVQLDRGATWQAVVLNSGP